jgi:hypothetical protein
MLGTHPPNRRARRGGLDLPEIHRRAIRTLFKTQSGYFLLADQQTLIAGRFDHSRHDGRGRLAYAKWR